MEGETVEMTLISSPSKYVIPFSRKDDEVTNLVKLPENIAPLEAGGHVELPRVSSRSRALELLNNACCGD